MATLAAVQFSCAFASPDPLDQAIQRELAAFGPCSRPSFSLPLAGRVVWAERVKQHLARHIAARHRTEREPHLLRLAELHQRRSALSISATLADVVASVSAPV